MEAKQKDKKLLKARMTVAFKNPDNARKYAEILEDYVSHTPDEILGLIGDWGVDDDGEWIYSADTFREILKEVLMSVNNNSSKELYGKEWYLFAIGERKKEPERRE